MTACHHVPPKESLNFNLMRKIKRNIWGTWIQRFARQKEIERFEFCYADLPAHVVINRYFSNQLDLLTFLCFVCCVCVSEWERETPIYSRSVCVMPLKFLFPIFISFPKSVPTANDLFPSESTYSYSELQREIQYVLNKSET